MDCALPSGDLVWRPRVCAAHDLHRGLEACTSLRLILFPLFISAHCPMTSTETPENITPPSSQTRGDPRIHKPLYVAL